jgi:hypothetical protein
MSTQNNPLFVIHTKYMLGKNTFYVLGPLRHWKVFLSTMKLKDAIN